ncbi:hypothetical protein A3J90_03170 [candidate division WOR-1 bacterium RIFOXYC2_FULL_37_10]|uniref:Uncharacterized protein n=1 Tax=candidate division WOR-1 bacterium RIFOXYB2_FULL_37_13 TaxID=1802579 RepID=A0A1F4SDX1_UNCSA|nr:MAG: hypothetical protein A2310_03540 [candidate division WOR-1 bacterium RIFOXYB2_FULL_37_13]OGC36833.1 MAG: hypothetical protein A3J90_03170 [candidate division WOR-1 bacterium RIFOXYC2_FULL_37_10]
MSTTQNILSRQLNVSRLEMTRLGPMLTKRVACNVLRRSPNVAKTIDNAIRTVNPCLGFVLPSWQDEKIEMFYTPIPKEEILEISSENEMIGSMLFVDPEQPILRVKPCFGKEDWRLFFATGDSSHSLVYGNRGFLDEQFFFEDINMRDESVRNRLFSLLLSHSAQSSLVNNQTPQMTYGDLLWNLDNPTIMELLGAHSFPSMGNYCWQAFGRLAFASVPDKQNPIGPLLLTATQMTKTLLETFGFKELPYPKQLTPHYEAYELKDIAGYFISPESEGIITTLINAYRIIFALKLATGIGANFFYTGNSLSPIQNFHHRYSAVLQGVSSIFFEWQDNYDEHELGKSFLSVASTCHTYNNAKLNDHRAIDIFGGESLRCGALLLMPRNAGLEKIVG